MNLPNKLSLTRIILVPVMMFLYLAQFVPYGKFIATGVFVLAAFTDFLDGYIARKYNLVTDMGKFLDAIADKMLVTCALILICCDSTIPAPYGAIVLSIFIVRDLAVNMLRLIAANKNVVIAADKLGKYKTFTQDIALPMLMVFAGLKLIEGINETFMTVFMWIGYGILIASTVLSVVSLVHYMIKNKAVFTENK